MVGLIKCYNTSQLIVTDLHIGGKVKWFAQQGGKWVEDGEIVAHLAAVYGIDWSPSGRVLATIEFSNGDMKLWDTTTSLWIIGCCLRVC